jgi:hypothetical protein
LSHTAWAQPCWGEQMADDNDLTTAAAILQRMVDNHSLLRAIEVAGIRMSLKAEELTVKLMRTRLTPRTGHLWRSVQSEVKRTKDSVQISLQAGGKSLPYLYTHEYGATIRPKGKFLRIPLKRAKTGAGVDRHSGGSLRHNPDFAFVPAKHLKGKNPLLIHKPSGMPWYVLKRQVRVPARPTIGLAFKGLKHNIVPELEQVIKTVLVGD